LVAYLIAVQVSNGDWHAHIVAHPSQRYRGDIDVLGRTVPAYCYVEAWEGVRKEDAVRLANTLKGTAKPRRREIIVQQTRSLKLSAIGGTPREP
jgi:hypothetical protein